MTNAYDELDLTEEGKSRWKWRHYYFEGEEAKGRIPANPTMHVMLAWAKLRDQANEQKAHEEVAAIRNRLPETWSPKERARIEATNERERVELGQSNVVPIRPEKGFLGITTANLKASTAIPMFTVSLPGDDEDLPPLVYMDRHKTLPQNPDGLVGMIVGPQGSHKTGVLIKYGLDAVEKGLKVLYIAAEGSYGVRTARLPTARKARGMTKEMLNAHWRTVSDTFLLLDPEHRKALIQKFADFNPDLIIIEVLTRVAPVDINAPGPAAMIMSALHELANKMVATVIVAHHPGKDEKKGGMGSNLLPSLSDFSWDARFLDGVLSLFVKKMKDGPAEFTIYYRVNMEKGPPVVEDMTDGEVAAVRAHREADPTYLVREAKLFEVDAIDWESGLSGREFAELLTPKDVDDRERVLDRTTKALHNAKAKPAYKDRLCTNRDGEWRWFKVPLSP